MQRAIVGLFFKGSPARSIDLDYTVTVKHTGVIRNTTVSKIEFSSIESLRFMTYQIVYALVLFGVCEIH